MLADVNKYFQLNEPWYLIVNSHNSNSHQHLSTEALHSKLSPQNPNSKLPINQFNERRETILYITLEAIRIAAMCLFPVIPTTMNKLLSLLHIPNNERNPLKFGFGHQYETCSKGPHTLKNELILFPKAQNRPSNNTS
jgi:methionyl-tRNA synthetase